MNEIEKPIIVEFPLRGEWLTPNTPGKRIPSHGTNRFGTRYAYDFLQVDWKRKGWPSYRIHWLQYLLFGVALHQCYCWGQEIYAPCDGIIVQAADGYRERTRVHLLADLFVAIKNSHNQNPNKDKIQSITGNYIIMQCGKEIYAGFAHLQKDSIRVAIGQYVKKGDILARVGHSGNSFFPHLHFQLMDHYEILSANGLPCAFEQYESYQNGAWRTVLNGIPMDKERIRFVPTPPSPWHKTDERKYDEEENTFFVNSNNITFDCHSSSRSAIARF